MPDTPAPPRKILIYAFATFAPFFREVIRLSKERGENIHWGVVIPRAAFANFFDDLVEPASRFYLYEGFNAVFDGDPGSPHLSRAEDNIDRILAVDKDGYRHEESAFQHRIAATMLTLYRRFLEIFKPDCVIFPPLETVDGVALLALCQEMDITPAYTVHMRNLGESFFSNSLYERAPAYFGSCTSEHRAKARIFIDEFLAGRRGAGDMPEGAAEGPRAFYARSPLAVRFLRSMRDRITKERYHRGEDNLLQKIKVNLAKPLYAFRRIRHRMTQRRIFDVTVENPALPRHFILYAAQVTPESSINTLAQFFVDQTRVIDLLRLNLPHGYAVLVKEHPAMAGSRPRSFYDHLRRLPGVVLVAPDVPIRRLIEKADVMATVTGTIGLEAFLLDKPCLMFGRNFFSHLCHRVDRIDGLRDDIAQLLAHHRETSREEKVEAVARLYGISYPFAPFEPYYRPEAMARRNIESFLDGVHSHLARLAATKASPQGRDTMSAIRP
jgi:hypothetical protein